MNSNSKIIIPIVFCGALAIGVFVGSFFFGQKMYGNGTHSSLTKLNEILHYIERDYVEKVNTDSLIDHNIQDILSKLDPHSAYISNEDIDLAHSQLEGAFEGIGVEFQIIEDTITVVSAISGGPSEALGIQSGDRIVNVDGKNVAGVKITTEQVFKHLRGKKGTKVVVKIKRNEEVKLLTYTISRDKISTHSVEIAYMAQPTVGYIKVTRFAENTYDEFHQALVDLKKKGMQKLVLDLRENPGGYLDQAVKIVDDLLIDNKLVVYTDGKGTQYDSKYLTETKGEFETQPIIVLINEGSASASEIVSGALQDHDRALIMGRRSFGKGLVQRPIELNDGSEIRLTISKYFTPSGRCIQKPFSDDYELEIMKRYENGEYYHKDSSKQDTKQKFKTEKGRIVYGGGGIMPDVFVPRDTTDYTPLLGELYSKNLLREFALKYTTANKAMLKNQSFEKFNATFKFTPQLQAQFKAIIAKNNIKYTDKEFNHSLKLIEIDIKAFIAKNTWGNEAFWKVFQQQDVLLNKAFNSFPLAEKL